MHACIAKMSLASYREIHIKKKYLDNSSLREITYSNLDTVEKPKLSVSYFLKDVRNYNFH